MAMAVDSKYSKVSAAFPFWSSVLLLPILLFAMNMGGWWLALIPASTWVLFSVLDVLIDEDKANADPATAGDALFWHKLVTWVWLPIQLTAIYSSIYFVTFVGGYSTLEKFGLFFGVGVLSGTIGINYSHELMHQTNKVEKWLADLLLASVLYSHFRSEHLLVHHKYIGTPKDPVTALYNEGFQRFFPRVLWQCLVSSFRAEQALQARKGRHWSHPSNPFWRYAALQILFLSVALLIGGWQGFGLFVFQAFVAIWQLELVNYVEHYGLTRKHLGDGKYEHTQPRHSWNANTRASNWLLINLQRHSDHHFRPNRRFPLLQNFEDDEAPQLPYGYPMMTTLAMCPPLFRRVMNPRVKEWRKQFYPEIEDWAPYKLALNPKPR